MNRSRKLVALFEMVQRALEQDVDRHEVLQRLDGARNWANRLMADLLTDQILNRIAGDDKPLGDAGEVILDVVRTYLK